MSRYKSIFLIFSMFVVSLMAQEVKTLSIQEMHEDIDYYYSTIKALHPNLYARYTVSAFDSLYHEMKIECDKPLSVKEFGYIIDKFNGFTDGHTKVVINRYFSEKRFPWLQCKDGKVYLKKEMLISIEGIDFKDLQHRISSTISWEFHPKRRVFEFNSKLNDILSIHYKLEPPYKCKLQDVQNGNIKDTLIHSLSSEEWIQYVNPSLDPIYHKTLLNQAFYEDESIAILYYNTSDIRVIPVEAFIRAVDDFFEELKQKKISHLFIDVSQNDGGSDLVHDFIFRHLKSEAYRSKDIIYSTKEGATRLISFTETLFSNFYTHDKRQKEFNKAMKGVKKIVKNGKSEHISKVKANKEGFGGEVYIIMGPNTYSAGHDFCERAKLKKAGLLVGESSGQYSPYTGNIILGALPNSMFEYCSATTYEESFPPITTENGFFQPDVPYPLIKPLELEDFKEIIRISNHY